MKYYDTENIVGSQVAYEKYKLRWMLSHNYTLKDLINELEKMLSVTAGMTLQSIFDDWEYEVGFGSEIWPCYEEYMENEYQEYCNHFKNGEGKQ